MDTILQEIYQFLRKLPVYTFYEEMNEDEQKSVQEKSMCKTYMITQESGNDVLMELCQKAENILKSLEDSFIDGSKHSNKERYCNYFKYWLNFKAKQIGLENYSPNYNYNYSMLYRSIMTYNLTLGDKYTCDNITDIGSDKNEFDEISKKLFYITENLYWIRNKYDMIENPDLSSLYKFLVYSTDFYNKIICENKCEENARYKSILEEFHGEFDKTSKYLYQLHQEIKKEELESPIQHKCKEQTLTLCNLETRSVEWAKHGISDLDYYYGYEMGYDSTTIITTVAFSIIMMFFLLLFLYKFTPLGTSLRHYLQRKNKICNTFNEFKKKILQKSKNKEIKSQNWTYNIPYQY
ncbi:Plasmodium vivax Vir protein, putative [Plasmodium ovale]|uniref:Plasmodium vivax Vir protein, putative n=1 Tax=Plasmodium ovale TaxID=36330 RepID=A0A1C3KIS0_PLAOA|nr:Plasmodium vivax Vir protein, putative [Plasmodium ovale]